MKINPIPLTQSDIGAQSQNEENTKKNLITPIILEKWKDLSAESILMEYHFTDGRISIDEYNEAHRGEQKKVDYLLLYYNNVPIALVEAKGVLHDPSEGYQQAKNYAVLLSVPFAYCTNGSTMIEIDLVSGVNTTMELADFPTPDMLWNRFVKESGFSDEVVSAYRQPYYSGITDKKPRYYQQIAINRVNQSIAEGKKRILLVMATGTGKTFTAFQFIWRYWQQNKNSRILYLADRNILIDQTIKKDFKPFSSSMVKVDNDNLDTAYQIFLGLYQQLTNAHEDFYKQFPRDFFDLIIVDECHRGSARETSRWRSILNYFNSATQIGMTATPKDGGLDNAQRELTDALAEYEVAKGGSDQNRINKAAIEVGACQDQLAKAMEESTVSYFGDPIYTYSLRQGIDDGFLAPYKVISVKLDIDQDGYFPPAGSVDKDGNPIVQRLYLQRDFDRNIVVEDRRQLVAKRISEFLKTNNARFDKTIVFCEDIEHAREMVRLLENENSDIVAEHPDYVVQITGDNLEGKKMIDSFQDPGSRFPVIAVTSKLLSTGVDVVTCKNVILDRSVGSMTEFKQIVGRGTRVKEEYEIDGEKNSKMYFNIIDFRSNYTKFNDPDFDGDPVTITDVPQNGNFPKPPIKPTKPVEPRGKSIQRVAHVCGIDVNILGETVEYLDQNGNLVQTNLDSCIRNNILTQYPDLQSFKTAWQANQAKRAFAFNLLLETDIIGWENSYCKRFGYTVDIYDVLCKIAYDVDPIPRAKRASSEAMEEFISCFDSKKRQAIKLLLKSYVNVGFEALRDLDIFNLPHFQELGYTKLSAVREFGGKSGYLQFLPKLENKLYE